MEQQTMRAQARSSQLASYRPQTRLEASAGELLTHASHVDDDPQQQLTTKPKPKPKPPKPKPQWNERHVELG